MISLRKTLCVVLLVLLVAFNSQAEDKDVLKVGFIGPLSGSAAAYGVAAKNGIELALKEIGADASLKLYYEDDEFEPSKTVSAFKKLVDVNHVKLVIVMASTPSNAIAPLAEAKKIPLLAWASDRKVAAGRRYVLRAYPSGQAEGQAIAKEALKRSYKKAAVFYSINDYTVSVRDGFVKDYPKSQIVMEEELPAESTDFKPFLVKAKAKGAQSFFLCINPGQSGILAKQARQLGLDGPLFGCENLNNWEEVKISENALLDSWFATVGCIDDFRIKYRNAYKNEDILSGAAIYYDLTYVMQNSIKPSYSSDKIIETLLAAGNIAKGLPAAQFVKQGEDQFLDVKLVIKEVADLKISGEFS